MLPYSTENVHWTLEPLVAHLSNEQLAEIESWRKKLDSAARENILVPPPDDYNALYFANRILSIDPANAYALEVKTKISENIRQLADLAYAREDWLVLVSMTHLPLRCSIDDTVLESGSVEPRWTIHRPVSSSIMARPLAT